MINLLKDTKNRRISKYTFDLYSLYASSFILFIVSIVFLLINLKNILISFLIAILISLVPLIRILLVIRMDLFGKVKISKLEYFTSKSQFRRYLILHILWHIISIAIILYLLNQLIPLFAKWNLQNEMKPEKSGCFCYLFLDWSLFNWSFC